MATRRVHTTAGLMNARAADDRAWDQATEAERAASRVEHVEAGWKICEHAECPPWNCRRTGPNVELPPAVVAAMPDPEHLGR